MADPIFIWENGRRVQLTGKRLADFTAALEASRAAADPNAVIPEAIERRQFFEVAANRGWIAQETALAAVQVGAIPDEIEAFIATLPPEMQFSARMKAAGAVYFFKSDPLVQAIAAARNPPVDVDELWREAGAL